ncbi:MAG: OmpW family protein [Caulobacter sp.]|nr:OmpW family protein [Caulobacter sp.]
MKKIAIATLGLAMMAGAPAFAQDFKVKEAGTWMVTARASEVAPDASGDIRTAGNVDTGLNVDASSDVMPTLGFTYFFTDNIAVEGILGTTQHSVYARGVGTKTKVHETWVLPPVVTVQYHFNPKGRVSPYVGAGVNAMIFYSGDDYNGFKVDLDNGVGLAVQGGVDVVVKDDWSVNLDVKKVFFDTKANINNGALKSDVTLDPWVVSVGLTKRF